MTEEEKKELSIISDYLVGIRETLPDNVIAALFQLDLPDIFLPRMPKQKQEDNEKTLFDDIDL